MRSFPDDKLPPRHDNSRVTVHQYYVHIPPPRCLASRTHFTVTGTNLTRKVSYLLSPFPGVPRFVPPAFEWKFPRNTITSTVLINPLPLILGNRYRLRSVGNRSLIFPSYFSYLRTSILSPCINPRTFAIGNIQHFPMRRQPLEPSN